MILIQYKRFALAILIFGLLSACGTSSSKDLPQPAIRASEGKENNDAGPGLRTSTPAPVETAAVIDMAPDRWLEASSFKGSFTFTLERDLVEVDPVLSWPQTVRSSRSTSGTILLQRVDQDTWLGEGVMQWKVDDFIEVLDEQDELIRSATAVGQGETTLDPEETLLWIDVGLGTYGLAIYPAGLYEGMEVHATEVIEGLEIKDEVGPLGYLGLMDTAGVAGWFEDQPLPEEGLTLGGRLVLADESVMTWALEAVP